MAMKIRLVLEGGPLGGQMFEADLDAPWPERLNGPDIHRSLVGVYTLAAVVNNNTLCYILRDDDDYQRLVRNKALKEAKDTLRMPNEQP